MTKSEKLSIEATLEMIHTRRLMRNIKGEK